MQRECWLTDDEQVMNHEETFETFFKDWLYDLFCVGGMDELCDTIKRVNGYNTLREQAMGDFPDWLHDKEKCECQMDEVRGHFAGCDEACAC